MKKILYIVLCPFVLLTACGKKQAVIDRPAFSADSAYAYIERQMAFGPRVPNSEAHTRCVVWLVEMLQAYGAEVELQEGTMPDYRGHNQQIFNIIGHFSTPDIANRSRIMLCAHYDTRPWCDEEPVHADRLYNVPGANDGASGVGVLLEVARQLSLRMDTTHNPSSVTHNPLSIPVDIIFFDVEDMGTPHFYTGMERSDTWCLGSQMWATDYANNAKLSNSEAANRYQYGILLDMVGDPNAVFPMEYYSALYAESFQKKIWHVAEKNGHADLFISQRGYPILDDHYYINTIAGIPCVDIIHYNMHSKTGFPSWWHTRQDDMQNISKSTLQAVGEVIMSLL